MQPTVLTLALWMAYGKIQRVPMGAYRLMRFKRKADNVEGWAIVGPYVWGRWRPK